MPTFNDETAAQGSTDLIPAGTIAWATVMNRGVKLSNQTGGRMADLEITLASGPFQRRKVWTFVLDPDDMNNSEAGRTMGQGQLVRMLEAVGFCVAGNQASYQRQELRTFDGCVGVIERGIQSGRYIGVKIGIQKGTGGYSDKNKVESFLTPNPKSGSSRDWQILQTGDKPGESSAPRPQGGGAVQTTVNTAGWGAPQAAPAQPAGGMSAPAWVGGASAAPANPPANAAPQQTTAAHVDDEIPF